MVQLSVVADTCSLVKSYQNGNLFSLSKKMKRADLGLILTDVVIREASKVMRNPKELIIKKICKYFKDPKIIKTTPEIVNESKNLEKKFYDVHVGDSSILAVARDTSSILLTEDKKLRRSAYLLGVPAYNTPRFMRCFA